MEEHTPADKWNRWKQLIYTAEALDNLREQCDIDLKKIVLELSSIEEIFPKKVDPVDDLEGFAVRRLCRALKAALEASMQAASLDGKQEID